MLNRVDVGILKGSAEEDVSNYKRNIEAVKDTKISNIGQFYWVNSIQEGYDLIHDDCVALFVGAISRKELPVIQKKLPSHVSIVAVKEVVNLNCGLYQSKYTQSPKKCFVQKGSPLEEIRRLTNSEIVEVDNIEFLMAKISLLSSRGKMFNLSEEDFELLFSSEFIYEPGVKSKDLVMVRELKVESSSAFDLIVTFAKKQKPFPKLESGFKLRQVG